LCEAIDAMTDAEADALLRWIEHRREVAQESPLVDDGTRSSAEAFREERDR
jgi:hypothetical protein